MALFWVSLIENTFIIEVIIAVEDIDEFLLVDKILVRKILRRTSW